jgi:hypothetical protein
MYARDTDATVSPAFAHGVMKCPHTAKSFHGHSVRLPIENVFGVLQALWYRKHAALRRGQQR